MARYPVELRVSAGPRPALRPIRWHATSGTRPSPPRSSGWRCARAPPAPGRPPKTPEPCDRRRTTAASRRAAASGRRWRDTARPRGKAERHRSRINDDERAQPARQLVAVAPRRSSTLALSSRRRGSVEAATPCSSPAAASRGRGDILGAACRAPRQRCRRRPRPRHAPRSHRSRATRSAPRRRRRRRAGRTEAAGSASGRSAAARPGVDVTSTNVDADGGSSSVLSSAFCASTSSASASSTITTRRRPSNGR